MLGRATILSCGAAGGLFLLLPHSPLITLALAFFLGWTWLQDWLRGPMCPSTARLDGNLAVVTGSNTGIGRETAKGLAARGARVVLACRNVKQAQEVASEIENAGGKADVMELDLQSFASVRRFAAALAARFPKLDILVNNAGVAFQPKQMTEDGEEQVMQVNHLSPFLLTNLLLDMLNTAGKARVVNLSSLMHTWAKEGIQWDDLKWEKKPFDSWSAYAQSKLANIYFTRELARRQGSKSGLTVYAVHPGAVDSDLGRSYRDKIPAFVRKYLTDFVKVFLKTSEHGAQTSIYCAVEQTLEKETGKYYADCMRIAPAAFALDDKQAKKLWEVSKRIVGDLSPLKPTGQEEIGGSTVANHSEEGRVLYSQREEGNQSTHSHLMTEIKAFPEDSVLAPTKCAESVGGAGLLVQEMVVRDVETFDKADLRPTETQEPMSGAELGKKEFETKSINAEVASFDKADLRETEVEVKNVLPNERDIKLEREKVELIGGIENFDVDNLARVTVREPVSGAELLKQELGHRAVQEEIGGFNQQTLKATQVKEGGWLPDQQMIQEERDKVDHLAGIERFQADDLNKVKTVEPLSGAELLKRELTLKAVTEEVASFDVGKMKQTEVEEKNLLPDSTTLAEEKTRETMLTGVETFSHESLSHVKTPEPVTGAELLKQEMNMKSIVDSVATFDSTSLRAATTEEKVLLPDAETLKSERERASLMANIESGDHALTPVSPKEPLGGAELLKQELTHSQVLEKVEGFDIGGLRHSEVVEKINLPDEATIQAEKTHVQHLATIGAFDQASLTPVKVVEPLSGPEVAKLEKAREGISSELAAFDKTDLKETEVEEKVVLPGKEDIAQERGHLEHMAGLEAGLELRKTETREPTSPLDLAKLELHKDQIEEELQAFDRIWGPQALLHSDNRTQISAKSEEPPALASVSCTNDFSKLEKAFSNPDVSDLAITNTSSPSLEDSSRRGSSLIKFSKNFRQRLSQSPVGRLRERLTRSPAPAARTEDMEFGGNSTNVKLALELVAEKELKFTERDLKRSLPWLKSRTTSSPDSSGKKRRLKDRLPTPKLALKPKEKMKGIRQAGQTIPWKEEILRRESAASFPEALESGSLPRNNPVPDVKLNTSTSMKEVKSTSTVKTKMKAANSLNDVRSSSFQGPLKPSRTFQKRPPWKN